MEKSELGTFPSTGLEQIKHSVVRKWWCRLWPRSSSRRNRGRKLEQKLEKRKQNQ